MNSQDLISIAVSAGCEIVEYDTHYCVRRNVDVTIVVTIPKVTHLVMQLAEKIKTTLGL